MIALRTRRGSCVFLREFSRAGLHTAALCACAVQKKRSLFFEFETRTLNKQKNADMRRLESHDNIYKWVLLSMLWVAYFLHQGTRQIYNAVLPQIQGDFQVDSASMGFVATSFSFTYGITVLFAGLASDFLRRKWMIVFGVLTFCAGIFISGFVSSIGLMMLTYGILNGLGQGCYYPPASSLLGQHFENMRSTAFSIHQTAQYLGIIICSCVAGFLGDLPSEGGYSGWRLPFFLFGGIGIIWAVVLAFVMRYSRKTHTDDGQVIKVSLKEAALVMFKKPSAVILGLVFGMNVFIDVGYKTWMPTFLHDTFGMDMAQSAVIAVLWSYIGAFIGIMLGSRITDKLAILGRRTVRFETTMVGFLLTAPFVYIMADAASPCVCFVGLFFFGFFRGVYDSSLFASLFDVISPRYRATGMGIMLCFGFIIGSISSTILGWMRDEFGMKYGLMTLILCCVAAVVLLYAAKKFFFDRDYEPA